MSLKDFDAEVTRVQAMSTDELEAHAKVTKRNLVEKLTEDGSH